METPVAYIPMDRRQALVSGSELPQRTRGTALFADISGFTPLTEMLARELGPKRGAEELTRYLNRVYEALIAELHRYGGSAIGFSGDAITCWFDQDDGRRATATALAMQAAMGQFASLQVYGGGTVSLAMKAAVASGPVRRFVVGDPAYTLVDVMAGATLEHLAAAEHQAERGEVVLDAACAELLGEQLEIDEWRHDPQNDEQFAVVKAYHGPVEEQPWPELPLGSLSEAQVRPWILPTIYQRLQMARGEFLAELRPAVALFMRFSGIDYDQDENAPAMLNNFIVRVEHILARYDANLVQLTIGDKGSYLYAVFGAPIAHEDDVDRAASAALDFQKLPGEFDYLEPLQIGITYGRMHAGAYGGSTRRTYGIQGDAVNLSARLMQNAQPGQILANETAYTRSGPHFVWETLPAIRVKGKSELIALYRLVRPRRRGSGVSWETRFPLPPIGRQEIQAQLDACLANLLGGKGQVVRIVGEAGLGKSHLAAHFSRAATQQGTKVALGICQSITQNAPYSPWRQIFASLLDLEEASEAESMERMAQYLADRNPNWELRLPLLGDLLALPIPDNPTTKAMDSDLRQKSLFSLAVEMLQAWAQEQPLIAIMDNAQWMDEASLSLASAIAQGVSGTAPLMLLLLHRPPHLGGDALLPDLASLPEAIELKLSEMPAEEVALLLERRLGAPADLLLVDIITQMGRGNPYFAGELLAAMQAGDQVEVGETGLWEVSASLLAILQQANVVIQRAGRWHLKPGTDLASISLGVPDSIHKLILSRLDRLPETHKLTLKVSSVIGHVIDLNLVSRVHPSDKDMAQIEIEARDMETEAVIHEEDQDKKVFVFHHHTIHDVAYETLLYTQRQQLHRQVAEVLAEGAPEAIIQIAHHAYLGQNWPLALTFNLAAGERSQQLHANQQSIDFFQKALQSAQMLPESETIEKRKQIHLALGELLISTGQYENANQHINEALALARATGDHESEARGCRWNGRSYEVRGEFNTAIEWLERGFAALNGMPSAEEAELSLIAGLIHTRQGRFAEGWQLCERSLEVAKKLADPAIEARTYNLMGIINLREHGKTAIERFTRSLSLYEQLGDVYGQATSHNLIANGHFAFSEISQAEAHYRQALEMFTQIGNIYNQVLVSNNLGGIAMKQGRFEAALGYYQRAVRLLGQLGGSLWVFGALHLNIGHAFIRRNQLGEAFEHLQSARSSFERSKVRDLLPELYGLFAEAAWLQGDLESATEQGLQSLKLAREMEMPREEGHNLRIMGEIARAQGDIEQAQSHFMESYRILDEAGDEYERAKVQLSQADLFASVGQIRQAQNALEQCQPVFARLEAEADLQAVEALSRQIDL